MTGILLGDMQHLRWGNIKLMDGIQTICIIQRKTKRPVSIPLNDMALSLLPPREDDNPDSLVFHLVKKSDNISKYVRRIKDKAGISKDFTYHSGRHATATLAITAGADISSVKEVFLFPLFAVYQKEINNFLTKTDCISIIISIFAVEMQNMALFAIYANKSQYAVG